MDQLNNISKYIVLQNDQSDCGVACLLSIIKFYGGSNSFENLRRISGTNIAGTTLLGLYQAANQLGFEAEGCEADLEALIQHPHPVILHVTTENQVQHYVVCFGTTNIKGDHQFVIGDPALGVVYLSGQELEKLWVSKTCLTLTPNRNFKTTKAVDKEKRKWLMALFSEDFSLLGIAAGIGILIAALGLIMAIFSQKLIDDILPNKNYLKLYLGIFLAFVLLLVKEGLTALRQYFLLRQSKQSSTRITDHFYSHLLQIPGPFFDTRKIGELTARLNDTSRIQRVISQLAGNTIIDVLVAGVTIGALFSYSWKVAVACLLISPFYFIIIRRFNGRIIKGQRHVMSSYAFCEANYISTLQGIDAIKNYNKHALFAATNKAGYQKYQDTIFSLGKIQVRLSFIANTCSIIFLLLILYITSLQVLHGNMKPGELMAILGLCSTLLPAVVNLALVSIPVNEAKIAFDRMFEFTGISPEDDNAEPAVAVLDQLTVHNMAFRFPGRGQLLKNISFTVKKGEIIVLVGENGCGKSTITRILQRLYVPETGQMIVNGTIALNEVSLQSWRNIVGVVPQSIHIFNGTVLENIAFEDAVNKPEQVLRFMQENGFTQFVDDLPQSFMTIVGEEGVNLSGGQKQMIAIMRALYHNPQLLILDEATAAMDRETEKSVFRLLQKLKQKLAVIIITHRLHAMRTICDRIYVMEGGIIVAQGDHNTVCKGQNLYSKYWDELTAVGIRS